MALKKTGGFKPPKGPSAGEAIKGFTPAATPKIINEGYRPPSSPKLPGKPKPPKGGKK